MPTLIFRLWEMLRMMRSLLMGPVCLRLKRSFQIFLLQVENDANVYALNWSTVFEDSTDLPMR